MPISPKPFKLVCTQCKYSTVIKPKSDTDIMGLIPSRTCPKCGASMEKEELADPWEKLKSLLWK